MKSSKSFSEIYKLPMIPLRGVVVMPDSACTLDIGREISLASVHEAMEGDRRVFLAAQKDASIDMPRTGDVYDIGTIAEIQQVMPLPDHTLRIMVTGLVRASLQIMINDGSNMRARVAVLDSGEENLDMVEARAYMQTIVSMSKGLIRERELSMPELRESIEGEEDPGRLCDSVTNALVRALPDRQAVLAEADVRKRLDSTAIALAHEISVTRLEGKIQKKVHEAMERANHEYFLREQINAIREELEEDADEEVIELRKKLAESKMPKDAREKVEKELKRLARTAPQSPEAGVSQNYIEYMLELPWGVRQESEIDIDTAETVLNEDHYGMKDVKDRLLEYLAVRKQTDKLHSPIICLVGAPGVGKTSIAKSVARALNRKFTQMSLGGVHDEAEIRGHRKTYVGAMPGRIVSSIERCGSMNPVFLLDEIDKISRDMRGDPSAALLEALDPQQNDRFRDHYLETPFDLSDVLFITTANSTDPIDRALLDRMEVIEVPSYTLEEKCAIASRHLLPRQLEAHGMKKNQLKISDVLMKDIIDSYTREAGVRKLERILERVCRKAAMYFQKNPNRRSMTLKSDLVHEWLGAPKYLRRGVDENGRVGVVNGLAWTSVGGEVMPVEVVAFEGKGTLEITGQLGDVMKESAHIARSVVRARLQKYGLEKDYFEKHDLHIHVPEGAVPKDGPSAGTALTSAIMSAVSGIPARGDYAMTGEVTLVGDVLPIGGVREKLLAAYRLGVRNILIPAENIKDLEEIDETIRGDMCITPVSKVDDVLSKILIGEKEESA